MNDRNDVADGALKLSGEIRQPQNVGQHPLSALAEREAGMRAAMFQQTIDGVGDGPVIAPPVQLGQQIERILYGRELRDRDPPATLYKDAASHIDA